jgi:hypothetical protein
MTHEEEITICEKMNKIRLQIQQFEERISHNESKGFGYLNGTYERLILILKAKKEEHFLSLEARLNTEESVYERATAKNSKLFILFVLVNLTFIIMCIWETLK